MQVERKLISEQETGMEKEAEDGAVQEMNMSCEAACRKLKEKFELPEDGAKEKIEKYWK